MNYFGHAVVACWTSREPRFVLGAMLPDFAAMIRCRLGAPRDPRLAAGLDWHHRTDAAFHGAPAFSAWWREGSTTLRRAGVKRGSARAAAHVGLELLFDGALLDEPGAGESYLAALHDGEAGALGDSASFRDPAAVQRWARLRERLLDAGVPSGRPEPDTVAERVVRTLDRRPRLALEPAAAEELRVWLGEAARELPDRLDAVMAELRDRLMNG